ncbi:PQQ-binding-like beta-propeller repeat protein [Nocardiopsis mangrovi]|uniref:PQQ-binding-like beta-propeller repeat protein n=1 Tax=Nocardiopsis mangrovi TaxID=1179818 RepID=A0ABV9E5K4_9ACTN
MSGEPVIPTGSRAILIGVPHYQDSAYRSYPAVGNSVDGMFNLLVTSGLCGWKADQVTRIIDPANAGRFLVRLRELAQETTGVLLLYFVGHGVLSEQGELCLALADTDHNNPDTTGLEYSRIKRLVYSGSPAATKIVILDSCFSGRAIGLGTADATQLADLSSASGTYTLTAADDLAHVSAGSSYTAFTGEFLGLLTGDGVPDGPSGLTLGNIYPHLRHRLAARGLPRPNQRSEDTAAAFVFARNATYLANDAAREDLRRLMLGDGSDPDVRTPQVAARPSRRNLLIGVAGAGAAAGLGVAGWGVFDRLFVDGPRWNWTFETGGAVMSSPAVADGVLYAGSDDGHLYAVDAASGEERWRFSSEGRVRSSPVVADGVVYVGSDDGHLYAVDVATGEERWPRFRIGAEFGRSSPVVADGVVYAGSGDQYLYAIDAGTGEERWQLPDVGIWWTPAVADGVVYFGSSSAQGLMAVDADAGGELWRSRIDGTTRRPVVAEGVVYVGSDNTYLYAIGTDGGEHLWRFRVGEPEAPAPVVAEGVVYAGSGDQYLYAIDTDTGDELWRSSTDGPVSSAPTVADGVVYAGTGNGGLYAVNTTDGTLRWRAEIGGFIWSSPTVVDGVIYVGDNDRSLHAVFV